MNNDLDLNIGLFAQLSELSGIASREERVREFIREQLRDLVDDVREDAMGNLIAFKDGTGARKVMFSAHMDEIGFFIRYVEDEGFLRLHNVGSFDLRNLFARNVRVHTQSGDLPGVLYPTSRPTHLLSLKERDEIPPLRQFVVDLGLPAERVRELVQVGDPVTLEQRFRRVGDLFVGKAMDNRSSIFVLLELLRTLKGKAHYDDIYAVFSVQEEVGLRGAMTAAYGIDPDIGVALDVTLAVDLPDIEKDEAITRLGHGVAIKLMDGSLISARSLVDEFIDVAKRHDIKHQLEILPFGGTDGGPIQRSRDGVPTVVISLPTRYVHTIQEAVHVDDLKAELRLLEAWVLGA